MRRPCAVLLLLSLAAGIEARAGSVYDELKVKRQEVFAFVEKPRVTRAGDLVTISFKSKAYCDATVVIENTQGRIVRHLISGVLGPNAPAPFKKNSLAQTLVWDGKNDAGRYIDNKEDIVVRVSLGLRPRFERTLLWSPRKRIGARAPIMIAAPEGVYVYEGLGVDHLRLFDHSGEYLRTVYPFPAANFSKVAGMEWRSYPHDGKKLPVKHGFVQASLLPSGTSYMDSADKLHGGLGATAVAVSGKRLALAYRTLARFSTDGVSARSLSGSALRIQGPVVSFNKRIRRAGHIIGPASMAFSPDGKYVYLTGYHWGCSYPRNAGSWHGVYRLEYEKDDPPTVFAGVMKENGHGTDAKHFTVPTCVDTDQQGRVYVADYMNDRVQIFSPGGKLLKSLRTSKPAWIRVHKKTGELYVFSWPANGISNAILRKAGNKVNVRKFKNTLTHYGSFKNPVKKAVYPMPSERLDFGGMVSFGTPYRVEIDSWIKDLRLWMTPNKHKVTAFEVGYWGGGTIAREATDKWSGDGVKILTYDARKPKLIRNFADEVAKRFTRAKPPDFSRQRLYFNPQNRKLYVAEDSSFGKSFKDMLRITPETGKVKRIDLPFDAEDMCFGHDGLAYLRTDTVVLRYDSRTWREVPWDYGEERQHVQFSSIGGGKATKAIAGLATPGHRPVCWHQGGMSVNARGQLVMSCTSRAKSAQRQRGVKARVGEIRSKAYTPALYPGRVRHGEVHVWDKHGKLVHEDAIPGLTWLCGTSIDRDGNIYVLADSTRAFGRKKYHNEMTGTLMKFKPGKGKLISASGRAPVRLSKENRPKRPPEVSGGSTGTAWVEGSEWLFGAAGWFGFNTARAGGGCDCWHSRFCLDYLARSFVPEVERYSVAILDSAGNVITRIGRVGNVDDGKPLDLKGGPANPRSIGGDEIALFHAAYVGTETDRRLFIHDAGNSRILSVKLGYHVDHKTALKAIPDTKPR
jgi:sugar lactone lactonase YvrE